MIFCWWLVPGGWGSYTWGGGAFAMVLGMILWVLVVAFVIWAIVKFMQNKELFGSARSEKTPLTIVKERYAKGELTDKQYEKMRKDLGE